MTDLLERVGELDPVAAYELDALLAGVVGDDLIPHTEYQLDPIGWAVAKLGIDEKTLRWSLNDGYGLHRWDGDTDPIARLFEAVRDWKDVGLESGTGTGKSYGVAVLILWFLACWENGLVFTFAPTEKQLKLYIWKNINELLPRFRQHFPTASLTDLCLRMRGGIDDSWAAHGYAVGVRVDEQVSTRAAGMHGKDMLLVYEETPGIPHQVMEAGENTCTAPHNLRVAIGNPNHQLDALHKFCKSPGVVHVRVSALDHPNVVTGDANLIPGAIAKPSIDKRLAKYGETSPVYQSRVRGISPEQASDALIRLEWLERSAKRYEERKAAGELPKRVTGKGVDVANSEHGDRACIADFAENALVRLEAFQCPDANALGRKVVLELNAAELDPRRCGVDAVGVGAGTVNEARRLRCNVTALNNGGAPMKMVEKAPDGKEVEWTGDVNVFNNFRSQSYWQLREDLRTDVIDLQWDDELVEELTAPTFVDEPKTIVEPKEEIKDRLGRSPDKADAVVMANWVRLRAVKVVKEPPYKEAHIARRLTVKDGKLVPFEPEPTSIPEMEAWAAKQRQPQRTVIPSRPRVPTR